MVSLMEVSKPSVIVDGVEIFVVLEVKEDLVQINEVTVLEPSLLANLERSIVVN